MSSSGDTPMPRTFRKRILRQLKTAMKSVDEALAARSFINDDHRHASLALLRMAPRLLFRPRTPEDEEADRPPYHPMWSEAEADDLLERMMGGGRSREECAIIWGKDFLEEGPDPDKFQTLEEAQDYGRKVYDRLQAEPVFVPHAKRNSHPAQGNQP